MGALNTDPMYNCCSCGIQTAVPQSSPGATQMSDQNEVSVEELKQMCDRAGLGMSDQEVEELKPVYDLYAAYARQLHTIDLGATEMIVEYHPDWPGREE